MSDDTGTLLVKMQVSAEEGHPYIFITPAHLRRIRERKQIAKRNPRSEIINNLRKTLQNTRLPSQSGEIQATRPSQVCHYELGPTLTNSSRSATRGALRYLNNEGVLSGCMI